VGSVISVGIFALLVRYNMASNILLFTVGIFFVIYATVRSFEYERWQRDRLLACMILVIFSIVFWALYQQSGMSLTIFTEYNVDRNILGWTVPTVMFQACNPLVIVLFAPILAKFWIFLDKRGRDPSVSTKFAWGTIFMGLGFAMMPLAIWTAAPNGQINLWWIVVSYFLQSIGELLLSPVGLSMVTDLSPKKMVGLMMGIWFFASAAANAVAGFLSEWTTLPSGTNAPRVTDPAFAHVFGILGIFSVALGVCLIIATPALTRMITRDKPTSVGSGSPTG